MSESTHPAAGALELDFGLRLRAVRRERRLSLEDVARGTSISRSFLSLIENGRSDISFSKLIRLVKFYGISVTDLMPEDEPRDQIVIRREDRRHIYSPAEGIEVFLLSPDTKRMMMPVVEEFDFGGHMIEHSMHEGEEFLYVLDGEIEVQLEGHRPFILRNGDSAYYNATLGHSFHNVADGRSLLFAVVTPPFL